MSKYNKEQRRLQAQKDRKKDPIGTAYNYNKSKHKGQWLITKPFWKAWCIMKDWKNKRGNKKGDSCLSRRDFNEPFTEDNIVLRERSDHNKKSRQHGHKKATPKKPPRRDGW